MIGASAGVWPTPLKLPAVRSKEASPGLTFGLFLTGIFLVIDGQWLVSAVPSRIVLPPKLALLLAPIWPNVGPATVAVVLFLAGMVCFGAGSSRLIGEQPTDLTAASLLASVKAHVWWFQLMPGLSLYGAVLYRLAATPYRTEDAILFVVALVLVLAPLAWAERQLLRELAVRVAAIVSIWEVAYIALFGALLFGLNRFDIGNWYYSAIGDEYAFYFSAKNFAEAGHDVANLFSQAGAYSIVPVLDSAVTGTLMRFLGLDMVGWKSASALLAALALFPTYGLARLLFDRRVAIAAVAMLATAHYGFAYIHTGYPAADAWLPAVSAIMLLCLGLRADSTFALALAGIAAGISCYYIPQRLLVAIIAFAVLLAVPPRRWFRVSVPLAAGGLAFLAPLLLISRGDVFSKMLVETGAVSTTEGITNRFLLPLQNTGRSLLAFNYNPVNGHFTSGSLLEPITAGLLLLGMASLIWQIRSGRSRILLIWFVIDIVALGVLSKYDHVSESRLHAMLPVAVLIAAVGLGQVTGVLQQWLLPGWAKWGIPALMCAAIVAIGASNLMRFEVQAPQHVPTTVDAVLYRVVTSRRCQSLPLPPLLADTGPGALLSPALQATNRIVWPEFGPVAADGAWVNTASQRCVVFAAPGSAASQTLQGTLKGRWPEATSALETDHSGQARVMAFYPPSATSGTPAPKALVPVGALQAPHGAALAPDGGVYIPDAIQHGIVFVSADGGTHHLVAGGKFKSPSAVASAPDGSEVVVDAATGTLWRIAPRSGAVTQIASTESFAGAQGVGVSPNGAIAVADTEHNRLVLLPPGSPSHAVAGFSQPVDVAYVDESHLLVAEAGRRSVALVSDDGTRLTSWTLPDSAIGTKLAVLPGGGWMAALPSARAVIYVPNDQAASGTGEQLVNMSSWGAPAAVAAGADGFVIVDGQYQTATRYPLAALTAAA